MLIHRAGAKHLYIPGGSLGVRACSAGEISGGGVVSTRSVQFDGVDDFISATITALTYPVSISYWVKVQTDSNVRGVILTENSPSSNTTTLGGYILGGSMVMQAYNTGANETIDTAISIRDAWHHVCHLFVSTTERHTYIDAVLRASGTASVPIGTVLDNVTIGSYAQTVQFLLGLIDDPRIYSVALSPSDISNLYVGQDVTTGLVAYWPLEEGSGTNTVDTIGGNNGTLTNGPTWSTDVPAPLA